MVSGIYSLSRDGNGGVQAVAALRRLGDTMVIEPGLRAVTERLAQANVPAPRMTGQ